MEGTIKRYVLKTPYRTINLEFEEYPDRVVQRLTMTKYGDYPDLQAFVEWLRPKVERYDGDGRPLIVHHPLTGQVATIFDPGVAIITSGVRQ